MVSFHQLDWEETILIAKRTEECVDLARMEW